MTAPRAADLPLGSVVTGLRRAWVKVDEDKGHGVWHGTGSNETDYDEEIQVYIDRGAQVLRVGDGSGQ